MRGSVSRQNDDHNLEFTKLYMMNDQSLHRFRNPSFTTPTVLAIIMCKCNNL